MNQKIKKQINEMNYAINGTISVYGEFAKKQGLNYNSLMVLYILEDSDKCTQKQICDILQLSKSTVHSILIDFIEKEYMTLKTENDNKKEKIICLTQKGKEFLQEIMDKLHRMEMKTMQKIGEKNCSQLVYLNNLFYNTFKDEVENEK